MATEDACEVGKLVVQGYGVGGEWEDWLGQSWGAEFTWIDLHFGISTKRNEMELGHQLHA